ncbi:hypothetical protein GCM10028801_30600 [Nocardioides maradonensis]
MTFKSDDPRLQVDMERARNAENRGRRAGVYAKYSTTGQGVVEFADRLSFDLTYIEEPFMSYGCKVDLDTVRDALNLDDDALPTALPQCTGFVTEWDQDGRGNYIGCWVAVAVYFPAAISPSAQLDIEHYFTFEAVAIKNAPLNVS